MCCVCRQRFQKNQLIRAVKKPDGVMLDLEFKTEGRGAYICKNPECIKTVQKKKSLSRSLKADVSDNIYNQLTVLTEHTAGESD